MKNRFTAITLFFTNQPMSFNTLLTGCCRPVHRRSIITILGLIFWGAGAAIAQPTAFKFQLDGGKPRSGYTPLNRSSLFSEQQGYGMHTSPKNFSPAMGAPPGALNQPFFFSVNVPEGNYKITLTIGHAKDTGILTVKAESRRLMLENIVTPPGVFIKKTFIVNVRRPEINTGGKVSLKPRETDKLDWDKKLTLEFNGSRPRISLMEITKVTDQVTVFLAGNSTVVNQEAEPWASWGQMITRFFKPGVAIANHAESGLTLASFKSQHRLEKILSVIQPHDYLFIEFGHNDQKMSGSNDGAWKSYTDNLKYFIREVRKKKAYPVIITSTSRRRFDEAGKTINTLGDFPAAARKAAQEEEVPLIDLNQMTTVLYDALGVEGSKKAFVHYPAHSFAGQDKPLEDNTHFNNYGAYQLAKCVVQGIRNQGLSLSRFLADQLPDFDPAFPDDPATFTIPEASGNDVEKPDGN